MNTEEEEEEKEGKKYGFECVASVSASVLGRLLKVFVGRSRKFSFTSSSLLPPFLPTLTRLT